MGLRFLKIAVVYLVLGALLGFTMGIMQKFVLVPVHAHLLLLGWASLGLAGVLYHLYPAASATRLAR
ncbi:MAG TPA: cytochrome-c oxidase, partial [Casimicrobiaceae bacterium]|nr:cytochrome-c oxidase [Casimicrobiaceae bacterium]